MKETPAGSSPDSEKLLFQAILDNAPIGIWFLGLDGRLQFVNKTFCAAVGVPEKDFLAAKHYTEVLPLNDPAGSTRSDAACLAQEGPHQSLEWLMFADGKSHMLEITRVKVLDQEGSPRGLIGLAVDVSARHQAEERLRLTAKVFENTLDAVTIADSEGSIIEVNEAFCRITGYEREDVIGKNPRFLQSDRQDAGFYRAMWRAITASGHWRGEMAQASGKGRATRTRRLSPSRSALASLSETPTTTRQTPYSQPPTKRCTRPSGWGAIASKRTSLASSGGVYSFER